LPEPKDRTVPFPFPFTEDAYHMRLGAQALEGEHLLIDVDPAWYHTEIARKRTILAADHRYAFQTLPGAEQAGWETLELLLPGMARRYAAYFDLRIEGSRWIWTNHLLQRSHAFTPGDPHDLPWPALDWVGREVQEDLLLLDATRPGVPLVAGQLFTEQIGRSSQLLMERLRPGRPVWRLNWAIRAGDQLDASPRYAAELTRLKQSVTPQNVGKLCVLRVERQTLTRLAHSNHVLFTIHTYQTPIAAVAAEPQQARRMLNVLRSTPPELLGYKGIAPFADVLCDYLEQELR
jgi:hypothetical protein